MRDAPADGGAAVATDAIDDPGDRLRISIDVGIVLASGSVFLWYFIIGRALSVRHLEVPNLMFAVAYPIGDLLLIFGALSVVLRGAGTSVRRPALILALACFVSVGGDLYMSYVNSRGQVALPSSWPSAFWIAAHLLFLAAARDQRRLAASHQLETGRAPRTRRVNPLPYACVGAAYVLLLVAVLPQGFYPWGGLAIGIGLITGLVVWRQFIVLKDNYELVLTDPLTMLANRRRLHDHLWRALSHAARTSIPATVMLMDLNDFKQVNDTLGHEAGDDLLIAFGHVLKANILGSDTTSRLGGDEFALVLNACDADGAVAVAERIAGALREPVRIRGQELYPSASIGVAVSRRGEQPGELLDRADAAMYRAKKNTQRVWEFAAGDHQITRRPHVA